MRTYTWAHALSHTHSISDRTSTSSANQPCIVCADDIVLLSCSCHGLQRLVDICIKYGELWDLQFNTRKTQCIAFGGSNVKSFKVTLKNDKLERCKSVKYLGCYFQSNSCHVDTSPKIRKYYGKFNIMSVLGKGRNEMPAVQLIKSYCVPILTYACEMWRLSAPEYNAVNVLWNNTFRRIFNCCWRESTSYSFIAVVSL